MRRCSGGVRMCELSTVWFFFSSIFLSDRGAAARQNSHVRVFFHAAAMGFFTEVVEITPPGPMDHLQYSRRNPKKRCGRNLNFWSAPTTPKPAIHGAIASGPFSKLDYSASETRSMPNNNAFWKKKKRVSLERSISPTAFRQRVCWCWNRARCGGTER